MHYLFGVAVVATMDLDAPDAYLVDESSPWWLQTNPNGLLQHLLYEIDTFGSAATNPNGLLQHLLYEIDTFGLAANEPERTFAAPPIRN